MEEVEFDGMTMFMDDFQELPIGQIQVDLHVWVRVGKKKSQVYSKIIAWLKNLEKN